MSHGKTVCKLCDQIVKQCRCCTNGTAVKVVCDSCVKIFERAKNIELHEKYPTGMALFDVPSPIMKLIGKEENSSELIDVLFSWLDEKYWMAYKRAEEDYERKQNDITNSSNGRQ